jgi:hypothetical protein
MYQEHSVFSLPDSLDQKIWRYLDFAKFVDLLHTSSLYFARADTFNDSFEGSLPKQTVKRRDETEKELLKIYPNRMQYDWPRIGLQQKRHTAINCWCMCDFESQAMWELYLQSNNGIAIQSTFKKLKTSFDDTSAVVNIGIIKYINYETDEIETGNGFFPFLHKRIAFEHEKELRAIIWDQALENQSIVDLKAGGYNVPCNINTLIENIYVSPSSAQWFTNLVKNVISKYDFHFPVIPSSLTAEPSY